MTMRWTDRWGPLTGIAGVALMVVAFALAGSSPDTQGSDAKITTFYTSHSHQTKNIVGYLIALLAILCLLAFVAALRSRLSMVEGGVGRFGAAAFAAGVTSVTALGAAIALFAAPAFAASDTKRFHLDPNLYRLISDLGYEFWIFAGATSALLVWSTMIVAFRTGLLPRWFAWASAVVGVIALFTVFFFPMFLVWLWIIVLAILLVRRPPAAAPTTVP
jgi:hypothetical protein